MVNDEELLVVAFDIQLRYGFESAWECLMLIVFFLECGHENQEGSHINFQADTEDCLLAASFAIK